MAQLGLKTTLVMALAALTTVGCGARTIADGAPPDDDAGDGGGDTGGEDAPWFETDVPPDSGYWETDIPPDSWIQDTGSWDTGSWDTGDWDTDFDVPPVQGFQSYTATVTNVSVKWNWGSPGMVVSPSEGWVGRFDIDRGGSPTGEISVVVSAPFSDAIAMRGCCTDTAKLSAKTGAFLTATSASSNWQNVRDSYHTLLVTFGWDGRPMQLRAYGKRDATMGDVVYQGDLEAMILLSPDRTRPRFRASAGKAFASVALPWDERVYEASEPYEQPLATKELLGPSFTSRVVDKPIVQSDWWGATKRRGVRFQLLDWDKASSANAMTLTPPFDLAGNYGEMMPHPFGGIDVPRTTGSVMQLEVGGHAVWGTTQVVTTGCKTNARCLQIGPIRSSYCRSGSSGGVAVRFPGTGSVTATMRATAKLVPNGFGANSPPRADIVRLGVVTPGAVMTSASDVLQWGAASSDGTWDTGWYALSRTTSGAIESGVAVSVGGVGEPSTSCGGFGPAPAPIEHDVTIVVDDLRLGP